MWVMTIDQEGSRRVGDRVDELLAVLPAPAGAAPGSTAAPRSAEPPGFVRAFERTVGDEVQAVLDDPAVAVTVALDVLALGGWTVGIGAGPVQLPLPASSRAGSGAAFVHAREAVEAAKRWPRSAVPVAVRGERPDVAAEAEAVLVLLGTIAERRTPEGRAVVARLRSAGAPVRQQDLASELGISQQAVSARLRAALWAEELAARPAAVRLLRLAAGDPGPETEDPGPDDEGPDPDDEGPDPDEGERG